MKKIFQWIKNHLPTKRRLIQVYAALLFNANLKGFKTGKIYKGAVKNVCTPGLNCYSCPGASGACPLGALQNSLSASGKTAPYYMFAIIMMYGLLFGRWICGFLCPFGLIQELLHKIPTPKIKKNKFTRVLTYLKYVILVFFVIILPIAYAFRNFPLPGFCKYICPAGTLEGAMGLLSNRVNESYLRMLGPLFTWKFLLMVSILVACVFMFRFFCRFLCPLGLIYGFFNKISLVGVKLEKSACTDCGLCVGKCKMDIKHVGDVECINCGECISACPTNAIQWKGSKILLPKNEIDQPNEVESEDASAGQTKHARRHTIVKAAIASLMALLLCGALLYYNVFDGDYKKTEEPPTEEQTPGTSSKPAVGTSVGKSFPSMTVDVVGSDEVFDVQEQNEQGRVVVLNFWYTTCGPCLEELPYFYQAAKDYKDQVSVVAVHIDQQNADPTGFIANNSGHPEWNDGSMTIGWDTGSVFISLFQIEAFPTTIIIDANGVISDIFSGSLSNDELVSAIEKALGN